VDSGKLDISNDAIKMIFSICRYDYRLRVYTVDKNSHTVQSWRNITLPNDISLDFCHWRLIWPVMMIIMSFSLNMRRNTIHLLSAKEGRYDRLLVNLTHFGLSGPDCLSVDTKRGVMYVGLCWGQIASLTLNYED
jgi:hypothetical protein